MWVVMGCVDRRTVVGDGGDLDPTGMESRVMLSGLWMFCCNWDIGEIG